VLLDDLREEYRSLPVNEERRWIGRFVGCVPSKTVGVREVVARIKHQIKIGGQFLTRHKLIRLASQILRWSRVDQDNLRADLRKARGVGDEVLNLPVAVGTLIPRISPQHDENYGAFSHDLRELDDLAYRRRQLEIRRPFADIGNRGNRNASLDFHAPPLST
jgi:hypothetical protein